VAEELVHRLRGFDARENERDCAVRLPAEYREKFLLRPDVECPLTVDTLIWPSRFEKAEPDWGGGLWLSLAEMREMLREQGGSAVLIAVELLAPAGIVDRYPSPLIDSEEVPSGSVCLGHDVADGWFTSGLCNCGHSAEELTSMRPQWGPRINEFGLLRDERDALALRELTDARVPEHAPFWVYRLSRIE